MPVAVGLEVDDVALPQLRRCPGLADRLRPGVRRVDVTDLALEADGYGSVFALDPAAAAFLAREGPGDPMRVERIRAGGRRAWIMGRVRRSFLAWIRRVAQETPAALAVGYEHERGDFPYEVARWTFMPVEGLWWASHDGFDRPELVGWAIRPPPKGSDPPFGVLAQLLAGVRVEPR